MMLFSHSRRAYAHVVADIFRFKGTAEHHTTEDCRLRHAKHTAGVLERLNKGSPHRKGVAKISYLEQHLLDDIGWAGWERHVNFRERSWWPRANP